MPETSEGRRFIRRVGARRFVLALSAIAASLGASLFASGGGTVALGSVRLTSSGFVTESGTQLYLNGHVWRFTGYDDYTLASTSPGFQCGGARSDSSVDTEMADMAQTSGSAAVRTWFFQAYGGPNNWSQYDRVLAAAAAHGVKVIATLTNEWLDCENFPASAPHYRNLSWWQSGYKQPDLPGEVSFKSFAVAMAAHYANNPTIAFWQLVNEGEAASSRGGSCDNAAASQAIRGLADDVGNAIKAVDHNHLISLGTMGDGQCGTQGSAYGYVNGSSGIDLCETHDYTQGAVMGDQWNGEVPDFNACNAMHKPLFEGESGIDASVQPDWSTGGPVTQQTLQTRAGFFQAKMTALFNLGGVGFLIWSYGLSPSAGWVVGPGDPTQSTMMQQQTRLNSADLIGNLIVTDGDPAPNGHSPGARIAGLRLAAGSTASRQRAGNASQGVRTEAMLLHPWLHAKR